MLQSSQVLGLVCRHFRARYDPKQLTHAFSYIRTIKNVSYSACCPLHFETTRIGSVTRVPVVQIQGISESLEGGRSDGMLKSQILNWPKITFL